MKRCSKCGKYFPATTEYFHRDPHLRTGLYPSCKACDSLKPSRHLYELRFKQGKGVRFTKTGRVRCQAVSKGKVRRLQEALGRVLAKEEKWPACQCGNTASLGKYACHRHYHGTNTSSLAHARRMTEMASLSDYIKGELAYKYQTAISDPELLNQRRNISVLEARNAELLEDLSAAGLTQKDKLAALRKAMHMIQSGDVREGAELALEIVGDLERQKEGWDEIRKNAAVIKDLTNAEMNRQKEMRLTLTAEQVIAKFEQFTNLVMEALEKNVKDARVIEGVYSYILRASRDTFGTAGLQVLAQTTGEDGEDTGNAERLD
jgi:hypothetical protein